jgi:hypothetical protein
MSRFNFTLLDMRTRTLMTAEIVMAKESNNLYYSTRFNENGSQNWFDWLIVAAKEHDEHWLAFQLEYESSMKDFETRTKPTGGYTQAHVPHTAAETFADGQFNRFYIAAICRRAIEDGKSSVRILRCKQRGEVRPESRAIEGTSRDAAELLQEVRNMRRSFGCELLKPNSGLSIEC